MRAPRLTLISTTYSCAFQLTTEKPYITVKLWMSCRGLRKVLGCQVLRLKTKRGSMVVAAYIPHKGASETLLVSHGNAVDLGLMLPFYK